jgi:5'(3')-deoxyribonucleotidase
MKIFVDYDTTLINLIDPWVQWINEKYSVNITTDDINRWYFLGEVFGKEADEFWRSEQYNHYIDKSVLLPYDGAVEFFYTLQKKYGVENVFIVSSTRDHHVIEKIEHAQHYFGIDKKRFIAVNKEKFNVTKDGILIDDYPLHVFEHIEYNQQKGIVFNYENRFGWCKQSNYMLDKTLSDLLHVRDDKKFLIATSYKEILEELSYGK